jgi:hypothetical protein
MSTQFGLIAMANAVGSRFDLSLQPAPHRCSLNQTVIRMAIIRWVAFAWGCLASILMTYYAMAWLSQPDAPLRNELATGFAIGMLLGWPAWLGLPLLAYAGRRQLRRSTVLLLLVPIVLAGYTCALMGFMGGL